MEMKHGPHITLANLLLVIGCAQECQSHTVSAQGRFDHIWDVLFLALIIKVGHILSGYILVLCQVIVGPVRNSPQLSPAKWEQELQVSGRLAVKGELLLLMIPCTHLLILDAQGLQPVDAVLLPISKPFQIRIGLAEELQLHLFKLPCTEGKVTRRDLVAEGLSDLGNTKGNLFPGGSLNILKVYKNTLGRLRTKVNRVLSILGHALECLKHQVKLADLGKVMGTAAWTADIVVINVLLHLLL